MSDTEVFHCATRTHVRPVGECPHCTIDALAAELAEAKDHIADLRRDAATYENDVCALRAALGINV
jgi:hypothetical protein